MLRTAGTVAALWRYPVKSMQGEALEAAPLGPDGVLGDRAYAVVDAETGHVASAKHPGKWGALYACRATFVEPPRVDAALPSVAITLPDGRRVRSGDPDVDAALSDALGRAVRLMAAGPLAGDGAGPGAPLPPAVRLRETDRTPLDELDDAPAAVIREEPITLAAPAATFFDVAPVHVLTTATLAALAARAPASRFDVRRFRPNIVVQPDAPARGEGPAFDENDWIGGTLVLSPDAGRPPEAGAPVADRPVRLAIIDPTPRCVVTTLGGGDLPHDTDVLRTVARSNAAESLTLAPGVRFPGVAGVYAVVADAGWLRCGDRLDLHALAE